MEVLHRGFDGLDLSFQGHVSPEFCEALESAKAEASEARRDALLQFNGMKMHVGETGARGGYAFRASTGPFGATWFFKKPNQRDPWGVRVSVNSLGLAVFGLGRVRADLYAFLDALGIATAPQGVSIGRVDYAVDILAPDLILDPDCFVMHSQCTRADHIEGVDVQVHGRSGRVTSVTIGKMPGRQVIVYDKRAEVIAKHKSAWWEIWNANREAAGRNPLVASDASASRVWRVELRAGKRHLHDRWRIRTWADLDERLGDVKAATLDAVRYCEPMGDTNRSRWPDADIWQIARREISRDLFELRTHAEPDRVKAVYREQKRREVETQIDGLLVTEASLRGCKPTDFERHLRRFGFAASERAKSHRDPIDERLQRAGEKYVFL